MSAVKKVAIVGAGIASLATAIRFASAGVEVEVFEQNASHSILGSGITLQGNAIRVLDTLGVWDQAQQHGFAFNGLGLRAPGPEAPVVADLPELKTGGDQYPAGMGMFRPILAKIMLDYAQECGAKITFSARATGFSQTDDSVELEINGAHQGSYDLLVGADGLHSTVRELLGITTTPQQTGMGIWRTVVSRPPEVTRTELYYGGPIYIAGYTPTSEDSMYAFLVEKAQDRTGLTDEQASAIMLEESLAYGGPWESVRKDLARGQAVNYTQFTQHLVPAPWNRGRVVIIGDAAHSCPPTIAQGAAQGLEDALVLTELMLRDEPLSQALWDEFHARRVPRATAVVEASTQLGQWQIDQVTDAPAPALIMSVAQKMAEPV